MLPTEPMLEIPKAIRSFLFHCCIVGFFTIKRDTPKKEVP